MVMVVIIVEVILIVEEVISSWDGLQVLSPDGHRGDHGGDGDGHGGDHAECGFDPD